MKGKAFEKTLLYMRFEKKHKYGKYMYDNGITAFELLIFLLFSLTYTEIAFI
jgi:hypothetical protein